MVTEYEYKRNLFHEVVLTGLRSLVAVNEVLYAADAVLAKYDEHFGSNNIEQRNAIAGGEHQPGGLAEGTSEQS